MKTGSETRSESAYKLLKKIVDTIFMLEIFKTLLSSHRKCAKKTPYFAKGRVEDIFSRIVS